MDIIIRKGFADQAKTDALALFWFAEGAQLSAAAQVDKATKGFLSAVAKEDGFKTKEGDILVIRTDGRLPVKRVILCGLGSRKDASEESIRIASASALIDLKKFPESRLAFVFDAPSHVGVFETAKAMAEGLRLASYHYVAHKTAEPEGPAAVEVIVGDAKQWRAAKEGFDLGLLFAEATARARDLVNAPAGHLSPADLARAAQEAVKGKKGISILFIEKTQLAKMGAGGLLGVGQGSDHDPVLVHMTYKPTGKKAKRRVALVGKAITFDSGGLSIKTSKGMETMKCDMAGAAAVIGVFSVINQIKPDVEVHGIFGACENMISGNAIRPGDVVKTLNGKTMEILNTDAEGRVTLADTLAYAARLKPDAIVDLATLTGAVIVALGEEITGLMSNNRILAAKIKTAADEAGESVWELPLEKKYAHELKSNIADYKNDTSRWGGSITAGLLLQEFVDGCPWVHLDIAGPAFAEKPPNAYTKKGGTGHGVRTLLSWLKGF